jgi:hypothetical protein
MKKLLSILLFVPIALFGQDNYSLSFDGDDDYVSINHTDINISSSFSLSIGFKNENSNSIQPWEVLFSDLLFDLGQGICIFIQNSTLKYTTGEAYNEVEITTIPSNIYSYFTCTYFNNLLKFYSGDNLVYSSNVVINPSSLSELVLGNRFANNELQLANDNFYGLLDNLIIWDYALTQSEIQSYLSCTPNGDEEGLIGYWDFDEGSGDTIYDISGNDNHGVIYGATYSEDVPEDNCIEGCTESTAFNYNSVANLDDGSCEYQGCMNQDAINFDETATIDDEESCIYSQDYVHGLWNEVDDGAIEYEYLQEEYNTLNTNSTNSTSSLQQALDTWNTTIDLSAGWNMFGYGCPSPIDVSEGLSNHTDSILITKDNNGNVYMPEWGFNGIGDFTPGFGYQIKVTEAIEGFSLCDWYVNDIPEDNIVSLQEENAYMSQYFGCFDDLACNYNPIVVIDDESCIYPQQGLDCAGNELLIYQVGDYAEGGIVFYVDETDEHGLVAAMEDLGQFEWGCYAENFDGAYGVEIGTGYQNTLDIVASCSETPIAASEALAYEIGGFSDWFLPSNGELLEMYLTIGQGGPDGNIGSFSTWYWSSTNMGLALAWGVIFTDGGANTNAAKNTPRFVRPIRSF